MDEIGDGIPNADMVLFLSARPDESTSTIAYAGACNFDWAGLAGDSGFGRPLGKK